MDGMEEATNLQKIDQTMENFSDTLAEWLRRRPAKPMGSPCVGSNPTGVDSVVE